MSDPCLNCGVCCRHFRISFYHGELDTQPGGYVPSHLVSQITPFRACMKGTEHGCGACIGLNAEGRCSIYENRPSVCREFPALMADGSRNPECIRLRAIYAVDARNAASPSESTAPLQPGIKRFTPHGGG